MIDWNNYQLVRVPIADRPGAKFAVRRGWKLYTYLDLQLGLNVNHPFWWTAQHKNFKDCLADYETAVAALARLTENFQVINLKDEWEKRWKEYKQQLDAYNNSTKL
jgi:hypothetical protein